MISVLILTLNEETNLPGCLDSVEWCDDIVVFDSFSTDRTVTIARSVVQRIFDNYAAQRNASIKEVSFKHPWVLVVDADERVSVALLVEIEKVLGEATNGTTMFQLRRKDYFFGRWLRRSSGYPTWFPRLIRPERVWVEREINETFLTDGRIGSLDEHLVHFPFNKGVAYWLERHNRYSTMEAHALVGEVQQSVRFAGIWSRDPAERRKTFKQIAYRLPARPLLVFMYLYVFRLGLLDGIPGLTFVTLRTLYEFMIDLKVKELRRTEKGLPV